MSEHDPHIGLPVLGVSPGMGTLPHLGCSPLLGGLHELGKQERVPLRASVDPQCVLYVMPFFVFVFLFLSLFLSLSLCLSLLSLLLLCPEGRPALVGINNVETGAWMILPATPWL